jgi:hypothetical protein
MFNYREDRAMNVKELIDYLQDLPAAGDVWLKVSLAGEARLRVLDPRAPALKVGAGLYPLGRRSRAVFRQLGARAQARNVRGRG